MRPVSRPWRVLAAGMLCMLAVAAARAQAVREPAPGVMLVADERMRDPRFNQAVVLIVEHDRSGSWGLVINKPTEVGVSEIFPDAKPAEPSMIHFGGPVELDHISFLYRGEAADDASDTGLEGVHWSDSEELLERRLAEDSQGVRVYAGYAGWAPGQLAFEIANGGWRMIQGRADNVFSEKPGSLWDRLTKALGGIAI